MSTLIVLISQGGFHLPLSELMTVKLSPSIMIFLIPIAIALLTPSRIARALAWKSALREGLLALYACIVTPAIPNKKTYIILSLFFHDPPIFSLWKPSGGFFYQTIWFLLFIIFILFTFWQFICTPNPVIVVFDGFETNKMNMRLVSHFQK